MPLAKSEKNFLLFFLPLFATKLLNITSDNIILKAVAVFCFGMFAVNFYRQKISVPLLNIFVCLMACSALLLVTSGKQGILFSVVTVIAMRGTNLTLPVLKKIFTVGVVFLLISCYLERNGELYLRYVNGEWVYIMKRSNILFVSYFAVLNIYLLLKSGKLIWVDYALIAATSVAMCWYSGSRTGYVIVFVLFLQIFLLKNDLIRSNRFVRMGVVSVPLLCMLFSYLAVVFYGKFDWVVIFDMMTQGRIIQGVLFLSRYGLSVIGQHVEEDFSADNYACLDSAYMDMLIVEGVVFSAFWIFATMKTIQYMYDRKRMLEVAILSSYSFFGITETFLINCFLNISILFYAECFYSKFSYHSNP